MKQNHNKKKKKEFLWDFLHDCKPGRMSREEFADVIYEHRQRLVDYCIKRGYLYNVNESVKEALDELYEKMKKPAFPKALKYLIKPSNGYDIEPSILIPVTMFMEHFLKTNSSDKKFDNDADELIARYNEINRTVLKPQIKTLSSIANIDKEVAMELLLVVPDKNIISDIGRDNVNAGVRYIAIYVSKMLRQIYLMASKIDVGFTKTKQFKKLFGYIFGKDRLDLVAMNILLERKDVLLKLNTEQQAVYNSLTTFALETINKMKRKHIKKLLNEYCRRRDVDAQSQKDSARRIQFNTIDEELYPNLSAVSKALLEVEKYKKYL